MKRKKIKLIAVLLLVLGLTELHSQEAILTVGGNYSGSGGSVSYSLGQVVYTTNFGTNESVAQGVQQPYEISVILAIDEAKGFTLNFTAYPNPVTDFLILKTDANSLQNIQSMYYQLFDINGNVIADKMLTGNETTISMGNLATATYFLRVFKPNQESSKEIISFKIIKNQ